MSGPRGKRGSGGRTRRSPTAPAELFRRYRETGDRQAREALIAHYLPLARSVAARYRINADQFDDLIQVASLALIKAVDGFDPNRGLAFSSYAVPTVVGELKRHFRDTGWSLHVPRALQERSLAVERTERQLSAKLGRAPTVDELGAACKLTTEEVLDALEVRSAHGTESIDGTRGNPRDTPLSESLGGEDDQLELVAERDALARPLRELSDRDREILTLRFAADMTQTEIAARVGVSQMQVSRILRRTLERLRSRAELSE
jgi:RNA polymerase sigma-B factor